MEFRPKTFYSDSTFLDTFRAIVIELEKYLAAALFDGDLTRVLYASNEWCYYRRSGMEAYTVDALRLPFVNYFRGSPYVQLDDEPFKKNIPKMLNEGVYFPGELKQAIKLLPVMGVIDCTAHFGRDDDATQGYERLMWLAENFRRTFVYRLDINGETAKFPVSFVLKDLVFDMPYKEREWLRRKRIIPIAFKVEWRSFMVRPPVAGDGIVRLTQEVITSFLLSKYPDNNPSFLTATATETFSDYFSDEPILNIETVTVTPSTTSAVVSWTYEDIPGVTEATPEAVEVKVSNGLEYRLTGADAALTSLTIGPLDPESTYQVSVVVRFAERRWSRGVAEFTTLSDPYKRQGPKGEEGLIVGREF